MSDNDEKRREIEISEITRILQTEEGRKFMFTILQYSGVNRSTFDENAITHAYNAGKRDVGLYVASELKAAAPDFYMTMMRENL